MDGNGRDLYMRNFSRGGRLEELTSPYFSASVGLAELKKAGATPPSH